MSNKQSEKSEVKGVRSSGKTKLYFLVLVVGVGLIVGGLYYKNDKSSDATADNSVPELELEDAKDEVAKNYLEGTLNNSDNLTLGNLKLVSRDSEIYLRTSRDFSKLVGLQVMVFINGTMDKFELLDIQSKVAGDGYILSQ